MKLLILFLITLALLFACTKDVGKNPGLAYSDKAMFDSINSSQSQLYYKNDPASVLSGAHGPHGAFKLRFNTIGFAALTDMGKLPVGKLMPNGAMVIKEIVDGAGGVKQFAFMYKKDASWIWGEVKPDGSVDYSVNKDPGTCISCHTQSGNRDLLLSFAFY